MEIAHKETNQKFGFKEYQMGDKEAIKRFMQISFSSWIIIVLAHRTEKEFETRIVETSTSKEELGERMADFFWS